MKLVKSQLAHFFGARTWVAAEIFSGLRSFSATFATRSQTEAQHAAFTTDSFLFFSKQFFFFKLIQAIRDILWNHQRDFQNYDNFNEKNYFSKTQFSNIKLVPSYRNYAVVLYWLFSRTLNWKNRLVSGPMGVFQKNRFLDRSCRCFPHFFHLLISKLRFFER